MVSQSYTVHRWHYILINPGKLSLASTTVNYILGKGDHHAHRTGTSSLFYSLILTYQLTNISRPPYSHNYNLQSLTTV